MTQAQMQKAIAEMQGICRRGARTFDEGDFVAWGCASVGEARQVVHDFIAAERKAGNGWLVSEHAPALCKNGKRRKGAKYEWKVSVDWAWRRTQ